MQVGWFAVGLACIACGADAKPAKPAERAERGPPPQVAGAAAAPRAGADGGVLDAGLDRCAEIRARFNTVHAARTDACMTAADCACFNPVGGPQLGCGGVTDAATATTLSTVEAEFHAASCKWTHNCAPWACVPTCERGRCSRG